MREGAYGQPSFGTTACTNNGRFSPVPLPAALPMFGAAAAGQEKNKGEGFSLICATVSRV
jgi:hypothetical protein